MLIQTTMDKENTMKTIQTIAEFISKRTQHT